MAFVLPFRGIIYREGYRSNRVMAPPYDVIDKSKKEFLKKQSKFNVVNLTLPETYAKAKSLLFDWFENGVLEIDRECSFYVYSAKYNLDGKDEFLKGIVVALKVEPFGKNIKPHEKTLRGPKIDRFNLITETNAMFCPIMGLYDRSRETGKVIEETLKGLPLFKAEFEDIEHSLFRVSDSEKIETIQNALKHKQIIIADGHHRYETALMIKDFYNKKGIREGGFDYIMTLLVEAEKGGLSLLAIHRLIKELKDFNSFKVQLGKYFHIEEKENASADFIMYHNKKHYWLTLREPKSKDIFESLNSKIFENYVYKKILGLTDEDIKNEKIAGYAHSIEELKNRVDKGEAKVGFILRPMGFGELVNITRANLTVPQKSTFFYPKMPSGLIGYHFKSIEGCNNV